MKNQNGGENTNKHPQKAYESEDANPAMKVGRQFVHVNEEQVVNVAARVNNKEREI